MIVGLPRQIKINSPLRHPKAKRGFQFINWRMTKMSVYQKMLIDFLLPYEMKELIAYPKQLKQQKGSQ
jgi:hypothetical protein